VVYVVDGYFWVCYKPVGVFTTIGFGFINVFIGIGDAVLDLVVMVVIVGDVLSYFIGCDVF